MTLDTHLHTQSHRLHARSHLPAVLGVVAVLIVIALLLNPPSGIDALGTLGRAEAATPEPAAPESAPESAPSGPSFPGIPGVDLAALGYRGVDLDAVTVAALDRPLPELPMDRASELRGRIVVGTAHLEGLREAEYLLYERVRALDPTITRSRRDQLAAWEVAAAAEGRFERSQLRVAELTALRAELTALRAEQPALDVGEAVSQIGLREDEANAAAARAASLEVDARLEAQLAARRAHRTALDETARAATRMDRHVRYLTNELRSARAAMLPAGRWLAEAWRGRADVPLVRVRGFRVHQSIAPALRDLLAAADADGIDLRGGAYRSVHRQIQLRKQNCGSTAYDVYQRPGGTCSPPTAPPGRSLHEMGLAIDFRHGTEGIGSRSSPAYQWLAANAAQYGFYNLPSEPWHWSVSGR